MLQIAGQQAAVDAVMAAVTAELAAVDAAISGVEQRLYQAHLTLGTGVFQVGDTDCFRHLPQSI